MGASENKALVRRLFEQGMNERKAEVFNECVAPSFVNHDLPGPTPGPEGFLQSFQMFEAAFPDLQVYLDELLAAEDEKVITRSHWTGTHQGEFMGMSASSPRSRSTYRHLADRERPARRELGAHGLPRPDAAGRRRPVPIDESIPRARPTPAQGCAAEVGLAAVPTRAGAVRLLGGARSMPSGMFSEPGARPGR